MLFSYILIPFLFLFIGNVIFINAIQQGLIYFNKPAKMTRGEKIGIGTLTSIILVVLMQFFYSTVAISVLIAIGFILTSLILLFIFRTLNR